ncbi:MAG: hypothetical protein WBB69_04815 [Anaerolineales bacterium]
MNLQSGNLNQKRIFYAVLVIVILTAAGLACNVPIEALSSVDPGDNQRATDLVETAIVKSLTARAPVKGSDGDAGGEDGSAESKPPTATFTPSATPSPTVTYTPTPEQRTGYISGNTNCRFGPGDVYDLIHIFLAGDMVDLIGKNEEETFWYIQAQEGINCWLWGKYVTPEGDTTSLKILTPPPTPTPVLDFTIAFKKESANYITVNIKNTGNLTLESYTATFKDLTTSETLTHSKNKFDSSIIRITPGKTADLTSLQFSASTSGHKIKVTIKICTEDSQSGSCTTRAATFQIP